MGSMDIGTIDDLPPRETLVSYVREADDLNLRGVRTVRGRTSTESRELPDELRRALECSVEAPASYNSISPSQ